MVGVYLWPDTYISKGIIKVEPQQLPSNLVQAVMTQDMLDRINSMAQNVESRATLTSIITTYNLYQKERSRLPTDDVLDKMVKAIHIDPLGSQSSATHQVPAFSVSFSYPDRHLAQKVTQDLISRFIDENVHNQSNRAYQTTEFLKSQQENAQKELDLIETRLAAEWRITAACRSSGRKTLRSCKPWKQQQADHQQPDHPDSAGKARARKQPDLLQEPGG